MRIISIHLCGWRGECAGRHRRLELHSRWGHLTIALNRAGRVQAFDRSTGRYSMDRWTWISWRGVSR